MEGSLGRAAAPETQQGAGSPNGDHWRQTEDAESAPRTWDEGTRSGRLSLGTNCSARRNTSVAVNAAVGAASVAAGAATAASAARTATTGTAFTAVV